MSNTSLNLQIATGRLYEGIHDLQEVGADIGFYKVDDSFLEMMMDIVKMAEQLRETLYEYPDN